MCYQKGMRKELETKMKSPYDVPMCTFFQILFLFSTMRVSRCLIRSSFSKNATDEKNTHTIKHHPEFIIICMNGSNLIHNNSSLGLSFQIMIVASAQDKKKKK